ncbi:MAG: ABC transporter substrate-binding protein [Candidatus Hydrothermarchaeales archaeon]
MKLRIGHLSTAYHTSLILMGMDIEKRMGVKPVWKLFGGGPGIVQALARGNVDLGYIGLPPAMIGIDRGTPIKCVAGGHVEGTIMIGKKSLKSLEELGDVRETLLQLEGRAIGAPPKGSIHDVIIRDLLEKNDLKDEIEVKNFEWADFIPEAMENGELTAAVGTPPLAAIVLRTLDAKIIIPASRLWPNNPSYGIIARNELIVDHPDVIEDFLEVHEEASNLIRMHPKDAARIASQVIGMVDEDFVLQTYGISPKYCASLSDEFVASTLAFVPVLSKLGYISNVLTKKEIFDFRFIEKVHPEAPHY